MRSMLLKNEKSVRTILGTALHFYFRGGRCIPHELCRHNPVERDEERVAVGHRLRNADFLLSTSIQQKKS
jgi:hypothetical protein